MIYFFTKTFRAVHVVFLVFTFGLSMWFICLAALEHKTKLHWRKQIDRLSKDLDKLKAETDVLVNNFVLDENGSRPETVLTARRKLNRVMLDRGRVWRGCTVAGVNNGQIQVNTASSADAAATPNQIDESSILYAFLEVDAGASIKVPDNYLGEFQATSVSPTSVTLKPTDPRMLLPSQLQAITSSAGGAVTWALHEIMPIDSHVIYANDPNKEVALTAVENQNIFGDMNTELIQVLYSPDKWIPEFRANLKLNQQGEQVIRQYLTNLMNSIGRDGGRPNTGSGGVDPEDNIYVKVQFEQDYKVDVDSDTGQGALTSDYYDSLGRAVVDRLRRSELEFLAEEERTKELSFKQGDFAVFHKEKADELIEQNIVKPIEPRFVRKLIDFTYEFRKMLDRRTKIFQDVQRLQGEIASTKAAELKSAKQRDYRKAERDKLLVDKQKFIGEKDRVTKYANELRAKQQRLQAELSALYRANLTLASRLEARSNKMTDEIDRRTREATAAN